MKDSKDLLILHHESGDEIHFTIMNFVIHWPIISSFLEHIYDDDYSAVEPMLEYIYDNKVESEMFQTYVLKDSKDLFKKYNIVKIIHLPELGS